MTKSTSVAMFASVPLERAPTLADLAALFAGACAKTFSDPLSCVGEAIARCEAIAKLVEEAPAEDILAN